MVSIWAGLFSVAAAYLSSISLVQEAGSDPIQCFVWDQAYTGFFETMCIVALLGTALVALLAPLAAGRFWLFTRAYLRIFVVAAFLWAILATVAVAWPYVAMDPAYFACEAAIFGAEGLFGGRLGRGVAAFDMGLTMFLLITGAALAGALLAFLVTVAVNRFLLGIPRAVRAS